MYVNAKMIPVETVPGIEGGGMKESNGGGGSIMMYLIYYKKLCNCYSVPTPRTTIKKSCRGNRHKLCIKICIDNVQVSGYGYFSIKI
jgi:hypothetical protein